MARPDAHGACHYGLTGANCIRSRQEVSTMLRPNLLQLPDARAVVAAPRSPTSQWATSPKRRNIRPRRFDRTLVILVVVAHGVAKTGA